MRAPRTTVAYVFPTSHKFRVPFHNQLRNLLAGEGINYQYVYSDVDNKKNDTEDIPWATRVPAISLGQRKLIFQRAFEVTAAADLVILQQENGLLANYPILVQRALGNRRVALFGHGRNFQARTSNSMMERFKQSWSRRVDWWFAYTQRCAQVVEDFGFPAERITVFNNSVDTTGVLGDLGSVSAADVERVRETLLAGSHHVGLFVGGLYHEKRLDFLIEAARLIRARVPDFQLLVIGGGPQADIVKAAAAQHDWLHYLGPMFGRERAVFMSVADIFLMPGLVGLAILDAFAAGTVIVTTDYPYHSPEIDYLQNGRNGVVVTPFDSAPAYAAGASELLLDDNRRRQLALEAKRSLEDFSIEKMVERFARGTIEALRAPKLSDRSSR